MTVTMCSASPHSPSLSNSHPPFPPIVPKTTQNSISSTPTTTHRNGSRRHVALLLFMGALAPSFPDPLPAFAFNVGISGPKDWLKNQKKKSIKYLLAPIDTSRDILRYAYQMLVANDSGQEKDMEEVQGLLRSAARDCVPEERNSLVAFQARTGVEVCTFKLVVKNASSLLDDNDPAKVEADAMLSDLIRSFTFLNGVAKEASIELVSDREKVADALMDTLSSLDKFEQVIKGCIDV